MSKAKVIVLSVVEQGLSKAEAARRYDVSWRWVHTLVQRYESGGIEALEPRSRRTRTNPRATPEHVRTRIIELHHPGANVWVVPKQLRVNNQPVPYLRNSRHEAARAARLLTAAAGFPVTATAVLIFRLGSGSLRIREHPGDVLVYRATKSLKPLIALPPVLTAAQVDAIYEAARWRSTWQPR